MIYFELLESMETWSDHESSQKKFESMEIMDDIDKLIKGTIISADKDKSRSPLNIKWRFTFWDRILKKVVWDKCYIVSLKSQWACWIGYARKWSAKFRECNLNETDKQYNHPYERNMETGYDMKIVHWYAEISYLNWKDEYYANVFEKNIAWNSAIITERKKIKAFFQRFPR